MNRTPRKPGEAGRAGKKLLHTRALTFEKSRSRQYTACSDGNLKLSQLTEASAVD